MTRCEDNYEIKNFIMFHQCAPPSCHPVQFCIICLIIVLNAEYGNPRDLIFVMLMHLNHISAHLLSMRFRANGDTFVGVGSP